MGNQLEDQLLRFGGGATATTITPATLAFVVLAILLFFLLPRRYIIVPLLFVSIFIPYAQVVVIGGLHFMASRIMLPFAWVRVYFGRPSNKFRFGAIDKVIVLWALTDAVGAALLWQSWGALVNRLGFLYDVFGIYFLLRFLIGDYEDVKRTIRVLAVICGVVAVFMIREQLTGHNVFSIFGGVPEVAAVREGRLRAQAMFAHPIVAGTIGATLLPLFVGLWWQGRRWKSTAILGALAATAMVLTSASATPLLSLVAGIAALCIWPLRRQLRWLRWAVVLAIIGLHLVMKAPVWALIGRINVVGGSSGWQRYELIDEAIRHFGDWWLFGTKNPGSWGYFMGDLTNAYVAVAYSGGLLALIFFIGIFVQSFRKLGIARRAARNNRRLEVMIWAFGATLFSTSLAYIGIWYFDQSVLIWYTLLAMICAVTSVPISGSRSTGMKRGPLLVGHADFQSSEEHVVQRRSVAFPQQAPVLPRFD